jgi:hypothetical protein
VLRKLGGSIEIDLSEVQPEMMGNNAGRLDGSRPVLVRKGE